MPRAAAGHLSTDGTVHQWHGREGRGVLDLPASPATTPVLSDGPADDVRHVSIRASRRYRAAAAAAGCLARCPAIAQARCGLL
jgi:hypothetical protein